MPDSPIFARDDCDTFPSAAKAGAQEREAKNAKTTRVFIEKCLSQVKVRGEAPGLKVPIAVPRLRRECANNSGAFERCHPIIEEATGGASSRAARSGDLWGCAGAIGRVAKKTTGSVPPPVALIPRACSASLSPGQRVQFAGIRSVEQLVPSRHRFRW